MKVARILVALTLAVLVSTVSAADGLIAVKSPYSAKDTMNRLEELVKQHGVDEHLRTH